MNVAAEIRAEMGRQGINASQLGERAGLARVTIGRCVVHEERGLDISQLKAIAAALNLRVSDLIIRAEENSQEEAA